MCRVCKRHLARDDAVQVEPLMYCCPEHAEQFSRESVRHPNASSPEAYQMLIDFIAQVFNIEYPTPLMVKQIRGYSKEHMTYEGMRLTIEYCVFYLEPPLVPQLHYGVAFIPVYYAAARQFYETLIAAKRDLQSKNASDIVGKVRTVVVPNTSANPVLQKHLIDIASLEVDDGE